MSRDADWRRDEAQISSVYHQIELPAPDHSLDQKVLLAVEEELKKTRIIRPRHALPSLVSTLSIAASLTLAIGIGLMLQINQKNEAEVFMPEEVKAVRQAATPASVPAPTVEPVAPAVAEPATPPVAPIAGAGKVADAKSTLPVVGQAKAALPSAPAATPPDGKLPVMQMDSSLMAAPKPVAPTAAVPGKAKASTAASPAPAQPASIAPPVVSALAAPVAPAADAAMPANRASSKVAEKESKPAEKAEAKAEKSEKADDSPKTSAKAPLAVSSQTPTEWLAEIRRLKSSGQAKKADQELRRFQSLYPDQAIPDDLH